MLALIPSTLYGNSCLTCHRQEVEGFTKSEMARSIEIAGPQPAASFTHSASGAQFIISNTAAGAQQTIERAGVSITLPLAYTIGSGSHAFGYLVERSNHLFQSPLSFYTSRHIWDMAPGYENSTDPDFSRPVTVECLSCHADKPRPAANTLNSYQSPSLEAAGIGCDRCHGPAQAHLKKPVPGSIINPAKLPEAARDSVCEQCHLTGEVRIPNPGKLITDFKPGERLEENFTVYLGHRDSANTIKVVSQAEQLRLSACARNSGGKLWCGTCHDPHGALAKSAAYYREKCLSCHASTLAPDHAAVAQDCVGCHMPRFPAKDGGHAAFTDHRIGRHAGEESVPVPANELVAWREPDGSLRQRNLALALVTAGMEGHDSNQVIRGYRMLNRLEAQFPNDAALKTELGTVLLTAKQPGEAKLRFQHALQLRPDYAPYEVNLADALMDSGDVQQGTLHLERAVQLDPLLQQAVQLLNQAYLAQGQQAKSEDLMNRYRAAMGIIVRETK